MVAVFMYESKNAMPQNSVTVSLLFLSVDDVGRISLKDSITFNSTEKADEGYYTCTGTTDAGTMTSDPQRLAVYGESNILIYQDSDVNHDGFWQGSILS